MAGLIHFPDEPKGASGQFLRHRQAGAPQLFFGFTDQKFPKDPVDGRQNGALPEDAGLGGL